MGLEVGLTTTGYGPATGPVPAIPANHLCAGMGRDQGAFVTESVPEQAIRTPREAQNAA